MDLPLQFVRMLPGVIGLVLWLPSIGLSTQADEEQPDPEELVPGLVVRWMPREHDQPEVTRVASTLVDRWGATVPDPRLPIEGFRARWAGWLLVREPGSYRFRIDSDGLVHLELGDVAVSTEGGAAFVSQSVTLRPGLVPIRVRSVHQGPDRRLVIDWRGPSFGFEHLPPSQVYHEAGQTPDADPVERGRQLADRVGCANCHAIAGLTPHPTMGPSLSGVHSIHDDWLIDWLLDPEDRRPGTPMPGFGLDDQQVADVLAALDSQAEKPTDLDREAQMAINVADPGRGRLLFRSAGCLGCHTRDLDDERPDHIDVAPDLSDLGAKRTLESVASYLAGPSRSQPGRHRPHLGLSTDAAAHLAAYLTSDESVGLPELKRPQPAGDSGRGRVLIEKVGCASCHEIPGVSAIPSSVSLDRTADLQGGCLSTNPPFGVPRFGFEEEQRLALRTFLSESSLRSAPPSSWTRAEDGLRRHNCLGCHARDGRGGEALGAQLARFLAEDRELNGFKGTLTPPDLSQVGAKLKPEALDLAIRGEAPTARPWLSVRMPRFDFEPGEAEAIASYLRDHDRVDPAEREQTKLGPMHPGPDVGITLLGRQGFGCLSCHVLDGKIPPGGEAETLGPDLALAHQRMSRPYFDRWLSDPQRILPGTAMPQFLLPAPGIEGTISEQLGAVWEALGNPGLVENASTSTRQFLERQGDRALVVRDMILPDNAPLAYYPRGLAIGLKGDRSVLFDTDQLIWVQWWDQGFLSRTKEGRLWEWHPEGRTLWVARDELPPILLQEPDGRLSFPELRRDRFGTFQELTFEGNGVRLHYDLHASSHPGLRVTEVIEPTREGWLRRVEVQDVPDDLTPVILAVDGQTWALQDDQGATNREGTIDLRIEGPASWIKASGDPPLNDAILVKPVRGEDGTWIGTLRTQVHPED